MKVELRERTEEHARIYFERTRDEEIQRMCPQKAQTAEEAAADFRKSVQPGSTSYGRTIYADGQYVGDIWCYCMHEETEPDAMISYCIFEKKMWGRGIAAEATRMFLAEIGAKFAIKTAGAFTYMDNQGSVRVLEKNGFRLMESFSEEGAESGYYLKRMEE